MDRPDRGLGDGALLRWAAWTLLASLNPRSPRVAVVVSTSVLSPSAAGVVAGSATSADAGKAALWLLGPAAVLAALRLAQAGRRGS